MPKKWKKIYETGIAVVCPYCLKPIEKGQYSIEHVIPLSRNGKNERDNTVVACKTCNNQKSALTYTEYIVWGALERIRNGQKNARDMEICKRIQRVFGSEFAWANKNIRQKSR